MVTLDVWLVDGVMMERLNRVLRENIERLVIQRTHSHTQKKRG